MNTLKWSWYTFPELAPETLYAILELRSRIFVVEQNCVFPDMDGRDRDCGHLCGWNESGALVAYLRLVPPGIKSGELALGRVVVEQAARGSGLGRAVMLEGMRRCAELYPRQPVKVSAQQHLERFYNSFGFRTAGKPFLEDGIWHINMIHEGPG